MYAGTFKVSDTKDHYLFYWYIKHPDDTMPLMLWLNGGPGASSMTGLFYENGPLRITNNDNTWQINTTSPSWSDLGSMIFLD